MSTQTEKSKDDYNYSCNFKCLSFVFFPFYDSYHRLCCVSFITSNDSKGAVTLGNSSCNLSRNFVATQVARNIA